MPKRCCDWPGCTYETLRKSSFDSHSRTHTGEKPYRCDFEGCNFACTTSGSLNTHKRRHTNDCPYRCDFEGCNFASADSSSLIKHKRTHTNNRPYRCDFEGCNYAAAQSGNLTTHKKKHRQCENTTPSGDRCIDTVSAFYNFQYCAPCGQTIHGKTRRHKREQKFFQFVSDFLSQEFEEDSYQVFFDLQDIQKCIGNNRRADVRIILPYRDIIVEFDEHAHSAASYSCTMSDISTKYYRVLSSKQEEQISSDEILREVKEDARMSEMATCRNAITNCIFVRYNPDCCQDENGTKRKVSKQIREETLKEEIRKWMNPEQEQSHMVEVVFLFYDGLTRREDFVPISPEELKEKVGNKPSLGNVYYTEEELEFV